MMIGKVAAQEVEMSLAPVGDQIVILAIADRAADDEQQHFGKRVRHPPGLTRVFNGREMVQKRLQARLLEAFEGGNRHRSAPNHEERTWNQPIFIAKVR